MFDLIEIISDLLKRIDEGRKIVRETQKVSDDCDTTYTKRDNALQLSQELLYKMTSLNDEDPAKSQAKADYERQRAEYEKLNDEASRACIEFQETIAFIDPFKKDVSLLLERLPLTPDWDVYRPAVAGLNVGHRGAWADPPASSDLATLEMRLREMLELAIRTQGGHIRRFDPFPTPNGAKWNDVLIIFTRSLSEKPARSREQCEQNWDIMFYAKGLPVLSS